MIARNAFAGMMSSAWSALIGLAVVPLYLKFLGIEAYGLLGFLATVQAIVPLLDFGLTAAVSREVARRSESRDDPSSAALVHTLAHCYLVLSLLVAGVLFIAAPHIAEQWLKADNLPPTTVEAAIKVTALVIASRLAIGLYQAVMIGKQNVVAMSVVNVVATSASALGSVLIITLAAPSLVMMLGWQAAVALCHAMATRRFAWRAIGTALPRRFALRSLRPVWRFSASMAAITLMGAALTQTDKLLLSRLLDLSNYGKYTLAATIAGSLYVVVFPMFNALYPRLVGLVEANDLSGLGQAYRVGTATLASIVFPVASFVMTCAGELVRLWTGDAALASSVAPLVVLLTAGCALHGVMHIPHALQLACGATHIPLKINGLLVCIQIPLLIQLTSAGGTIGAAWAFLLLHLAYCAVSCWLTYRQFFVSEGRGWLLVDVGGPLIISVSGGFVTVLASMVFTGSPLAKIFIALVVLGVTLAICLARTGGLPWMARRRATSDHGSAGNSPLQDRPR